MMRKSTRKLKPGRPRAADKTANAVFFRLTTAELQAVEKAAKKGGYETVHAYAKALVLVKSLGGGV